MKINIFIYIFVLYEAWFRSSFFQMERSHPLALPGQMG
jgi:hypothetical protein